jgi:hypothetical protein
MQQIRGTHTKPDTSTEDVTILGATLKANDDIYVFYIDSEGNICGDEAAKFLTHESLFEITNG